MCTVPVTVALEPAMTSPLSAVVSGIEACTRRNIAQMLFIGGEGLQVPKDYA